MFVDGLETSVHLSLSEVKSMVGLSSVVWELGEQKASGFASVLV